MTIRAITAEYPHVSRDRVENFHGQQLLNLCWEQHTMFGWPMCIPVEADMPFAALIEQVIPQIYGAHPDFKKIHWEEVVWSTRKGELIPDPQKSLKDHGFQHKETVRFRTPGLDGLGGAG